MRVSGLFSLENRIVLLTGASGQFGSMFAQALASAGAALVLAGRDQARLADTARALGASTIATVCADLNDDAGVEALFHTLSERVEGLDVLINNAGMKAASPFGALTSDEVRAMTSVNVAAPLLCAQRAVPLMQRRGGGKIVNVGSIYGSIGVDTRIYESSPGMVQASPAYVATKAALVNLTRDLATRLGPLNIQVNMLSPGGVEAGQPEAFQREYGRRTPAGRMATPGDLIGTLIYLCAPASDYVTGQNILVDGGFTAW